MKTVDLNSTMWNTYTIDAAKIDRRDRRVQNQRHSKQTIVHGWKAAHVRFKPYRRAASFATRSIVKAIAIREQS